MRSIVVRGRSTTSSQSAVTMRQPHCSSAALRTWSRFHWLRALCHSKPSVSKHLSILENAGLIHGDKRGQYIHYSLVSDNLVNTLNGYVQEVCPVSRPLKRESRKLAASKQASRLGDE